MYDMIVMIGSRFGIAHRSTTFLYELILSIQMSGWGQSHLRQQRFTFRRSHGHGASLHIIHQTYLLFTGIRLPTQIVVSAYGFVKQSFFPRFILRYLFREPQPQKKPRRPHTTGPTPHQLKTPTPKTRSKTTNLTPQYHNLQPLNHHKWAKMRNKSKNTPGKKYSVCQNGSSSVLPTVYAVPSPKCGKNLKQTG